MPHLFEARVMKNSDIKQIKHSQVNPTQSSQPPYKILNL